MLHPNRLGTASLQAPAFVEQEFPDKTGAFWIGRSPFLEGEVAPEGPALGIDDDRHFLLVGGTRGGKGTGFIVPNLCLWPGSVVCLDPKGENAMLTADARAEGRNGHPQPVYVLDPFGIAKIVNGRLRASFNPLWELMEPDPDGEDWGTPADDDYEPAMRPVAHAVDEASVIASAIVVDDKESKNPFWNTSARRMIGALILHVISHPRFQGRRNLITVRRLLMAGDEDLLRAVQVENPEVTNAAELMWNDIALNDAFDGVIHEDGAFIADMMRTDAETYMSVAATAASHTEFLKSPDLRKTLKRSSFRLEELKTAKTGISLYLCLPMRFMTTEHFRWLRMIIGLVTQQMEKTDVPCASGHKVLMMLDEFTSLGRMKYLEEALTQYAGHGLKMFFAVQTLDRLKAAYPDTWESFVSQCGVKCFFNADDHFTRKYISELVGETEVCIRNAGESSTDTHTGGWSEVETSGHSTGGGTADGIGTSHQKGVSTSWNQGQGGGSNQSRNSSRNTGSSDTKGYGFGENESRGGSQGVSRVAYKSLFFGKKYKPEWTESSGTNWSQGRSYNENYGHTDSSGYQEGEGSGTSASWSKGEGGGRNESDGTNSNRTVSTTYQDSTSRAKGRSGSDANAKGRTTTEQWQRRPIFLPEEVGRFFAGQSKKTDDRYPGLALVLVGGDVSMVVRRIIYYADPRFVGLFNPHRKYPFIPYAPPVPPALPEDEQHTAIVPESASIWVIGLVLLVFVGSSVAVVAAMRQFGMWPVLLVLLAIAIAITVWMFLQPNAKKEDALPQKIDDSAALAPSGVDPEVWRTMFAHEPITAARESKKLSSEGPKAGCRNEDLI